MVMKDVYIITCTVLLMLSAFVVVYGIVFGRNRKIIKTVEVNPPDGLSPLEMGYITDGSVDGNDIIANLFDLANRGYLNIQNVGDKFYIEKTKELPDDAKEYEKFLVEELMMLGDGYSFETSDINGAMYYIRIYLERKLKNHLKEDKFWSTSVMAIVLYLGIFLLGNGLLLLSSPSAVPVSLTFCLVFMYGVVFVRSITQMKGKKGFGLKIILFFMLILVSAGFLFMLKTHGISLLTVLSMVLNTTVILAFANRNRMTKNGRDVLGRLHGFREYLRSVEMDRLEVMMEQETGYIYDILPYLYVYDYTKLKKGFRKAGFRPKWYYSDSGYDFATFSRKTDKLNSAIEMYFTFSDGYEEENEIIEHYLDMDM